MKPILFLLQIIVIFLINHHTMAHATENTKSEAKVTPLMLKALSDSPNKEALMLTVEYPPGGETAAHRHDAHIFVYVLEGAVIMQVKGNAPVTLAAGDVFYEAPNDIHVTSKNASNSETAKFIVVSIKNKGAPALLPLSKE